MNAPDRAARSLSAPLTEPTEAGEQTLIPGVAAINLNDRLAIRAEAPLVPTKPQRAMDIGLFDLAARNQLDLF